MYVQSFPQLVGKKFGELMGYFPTCTLYGLIKRKEHKCVLNPAPDLVVGPDDELIMLRDRLNLLSQLQPLPTPIPIDLGGAHISALPSSPSSLHRRLLPPSRLFFCK